MNAQLSIKQDIYARRNVLLGREGAFTNCGGASRVGEKFHFRKSLAGVLKGDFGLKFS